MKIFQCHVVFTFSFCLASLVFQAYYRLEWISAETSEAEVLQARHAFSSQADGLKLQI